MDLFETTGSLNVGKKIRCIMWVENFEFTFAVNTNCDIAYNHNLHKL